MSENRDSGLSYLSLITSVTAIPEASFGDGIPMILQTVGAISISLKAGTVWPLAILEPAA